MKRTFLIIIIISFCFTVRAQKSDSTHTHYAFYRGFSTHETELKSKRGILNGEYQILNGRKITASGAYKDGARYGRWRFFFKDTIDQVYNYTTKTVEYNRPEEKITFFIDSLEVGDKVIYPKKIMGDFGLFLLTRNYIPPFEIQKKVGEFNLYFIFTIDKDGKLTKYETKVASLNFNKVTEFSLKILKPDDLEFSPAQVNGKNVKSTLIFEGTLGVNLKR